MKKFIASTISLLMLLTFAGCGDNSGDTSSLKDDIFALENNISVISREAGSGIRNIFASVFDLLDMNDEKNDSIFSSAEIVDSEGAILSSVKKNKHAIAYIPLSHINDSVKALKVDGVEPTIANVKNKTYKLSHPVNAVTKKDTDLKIKDFLNFVLSKEGQQIITDSSLVSVDSTQSFKTENPEGTLKIQCSSSALNVIKKLKDEYMKLNEKLKIEITDSNSTNALSKLQSGECDIAFISRGLYKSENGDYALTLVASDAVALIVNKENSISDIKSSRVTDIFKGTVKTWNDAVK